ncbi:Regulatory protein LuxO [Vibrio stylophorae]|uniref:Regulatory protein LuxO n=2 Tax=Vibrio stylophorae TaxID=659351 RepID=A0ABM8ZSR5_9VIBR|nr:Regulatory protein LuxO [Vibrio stylophorae]
MAHSKRILMVEDTASVATLYCSYLLPLAFDIEVAKDGGAALIALKKEPFDMVLLDLRLPDMTGMQILNWIQRECAHIPVIVMTAHGSIDVAVEAMREGAQDFLIKPCEANILRATVGRVFRQQQTVLASGEHNVEAPSPDAEHELGDFYGFIGQSPAMASVYEVIRSAAKSRATVFVTGESGTGKELCAEAIHQASDRNQGPFVAINCAAIPNSLIESELFGHVKGAFTGAASERKGAAELAHGGTLFLDEIGEMELDLQTKLLRFIQTGLVQKVGSSEQTQVDVRFVCATNRDPWLMVQAGQFREDLYYRLQVIPLSLPALRERGEDVMRIADILLAQICVEEGKQFASFSSQAQQQLKQYQWPGNVRQLQNVIRNIVVLNDGEIVTAEMLPQAVMAQAHPSLNAHQGLADGAHLTVKQGAQGETISHHCEIEPLWITEKRTIEAAIAICDGNIPQAAGRLEVSPSTLYRKLQSWQAQSGE